MSENDFRKEPTMGRPSNLEGEANLSGDKKPEFKFTPVDKPNPSIDAGNQPKVNVEKPRIRVGAPNTRVESVNTEVEKPAFEKRVFEAPKQPEAPKVETPKPNVEQPIRVETPKVNVETPKVETTSEPVKPERVIPPPMQPAKQTQQSLDFDKPTPKGESFFAKYKRLLLVLLLAILLGLLFFILKPSTPETVEELEAQQGNSLPIEFRPVDEEAAKKAEEEARAELQAQQQAEAEAAKAKADADAKAVAEAKAKAEQLAAEQKLQADKAQAAATEQANATADDAAAAKAKADQLAKAQAAKEAEAKRIAEAKAAAEKAKAEKAAKAKEATASTTSVGGKTLTMKSGVSLMQLFRDNNLSIADVNAMSRASGGSKVFASLHPGDKVSLKLNSKNRVTEMSVKGKRFVRQSNGTYILK